jgi:hypothetical protein
MGYLMTLHQSKNDKLIYSNFKINHLFISSTKTKKLQLFVEELESKSQDLSRRTLIIVPGYSVSNPPRIGDHRFYIEALQYHPETNPNGYKRIYVFDLYSEKDGRCNFKHSIPQLANELYLSITTSRDNWKFVLNGEIDFIGASMGGLIVRKFIQDYLKDDNLLKTDTWGKMQIKNILLIATPNNGCEIIDKLQIPFVQFILRLLFGKNNFSQSLQLKQIAKGNVHLYNKLWKKLFPRKTKSNSFLNSLNSMKLPKSIRWITLSGTKKKWFSSFIYDKLEENDGVVQVSSVVLDGAENIIDKDLEMNLQWDHRDLYQHESVCKLLYGLLVLNLKLEDYRLLNQLLQTQKIIEPNRKGFGQIFDKLVLDNKLHSDH